MNSHISKAKYRIYHLICALLFKYIQINKKESAYLKCTALVFMFPPMQFLMFTTTIECFMAASTALICLNMTKGTDKLIGIDVTHDLA